MFDISCICVLFIKMSVQYMPVYSTWFGCEQFICGCEMTDEI